MKKRKQEIDTWRQVSISCYSYEGMMIGIIS